MKKGYFFAFFCFLTYLLSAATITEPTIKEGKSVGETYLPKASALTVTITPPPNTPPFCTGNTYQFTGNANPGPILFYNWSCTPIAGVTITNGSQSGAGFNFASPGSYTLTLIASNTGGIQDSAKYSLTVLPTPTVVASPLAPQICRGGPGTNLYATGASTYTWTGTGITTTYANGDSTNINPANAGVYTYTVQGTQAGCVSAPVMLTATVNPPPTPTITVSPDTICSTGTTSMTVGGMPSTTSFTWTAQPTAGLGANSSYSVVATPVYLGSVDTIYKYQINLSVPGCPTYPAYSASLYVIPTPTVYPVSDTTENCNKLGDSLRVTSVPSQALGTTYSWTPSTGLSATSGNPVFAHPLNQTWYYVTPTYKGCVGRKDSIVMLIGDTTLADIEAKYLIVCSGDTDMLMGFPALSQLNNTYQYSWAPTTGPSTVTPINANGDTVLIHPIATTIYTLTVNGTCVRKKTSELTIYVNQCPPITNANFSISNDTICVNHCIYFKDLTHNNNVLPLFYEWIFTGGQAFGVAGQIVVTPPDTAYVEATDSTAIPQIKVCYHINSSLNAGGVFPVQMIVSHAPIGSGGATYTVTQNVKVDAGPIANAGNNVTINLGDSVQLNGGSSTGNFTIVNYAWTPPDSLHCPQPPYNQCIAPWAQPSQTTHYYLTITDKNGCVSTDSMTVYVDLKCYDPFIPTAFSPNDDGHNDVLYVRSNCMQNFTFKVFDRWGEKVFETTALNYGWDGTFRNTPVNAGVFVWTLEGFLSNGKEIKKHGSTTLVR